MNIPEMIEVLKAAERGEDIEYRTYLAGAPWMPWDKGRSWCFDRCVYRIAPKKERSLVEELLAAHAATALSVYQRAADRIAELEALYASSISAFTTDELLAEIKRRMA